ncbi:MAG TPA: DUF937 domain-containing protein [Chryseolinea sp.]|nr:DUF937 domain-containing protein [Chryseolinea sp.]
MLDQLLKLVEQNAGDAIVKNQAIPNQFNNAAVKEVASHIFNGLQGQVAQGNMQQVVSMFKGQSASSLANNPMVSNMINQVAGSFAQKFGVSPQVAQGIAANLLPQVMNQFVTKTNDPSDNDFDLQNMMRSFSGNQSLDVGSIIGKVAGGKSGGIGDVLANLFGGK